MATSSQQARQDRKRRGQYKALKRILLSLLILAMAATALWLGRERLPPPPSRLDEGEIRLHFIDVGQGDAALIQTTAGYILIDAGTNESEDRLQAYLDHLGVETLLCAVFTHPDEDHIGGADRILRSYRVEKVLLPPTEAPSQTYRTMMTAIEAEECEILWAAPETILSFGPLTCTVLAPLRADYEETNNHSIVLRLDYGETSALFTGDAEAPVEADLLSRYGTDGGGPLDCDILKIGHHGSETSSGQAFLQAVTPTVAVISCGEGNPHGHPSPSVLTRLEKTDTTVYRTDRHGTVVLTSTGGEPSVS